MVARSGAVKQLQAAGADDSGPEIISLRTAEHTEDERTDLFDIDGVMYTISTRPQVNKSLRYLHLARTQGVEAAIGYMLETLLGEEGYEALMGFEDLTQEELEQIITIASKVMAGPVETPKGKQRRG